MITFCCLLFSLYLSLQFVSCLLSWEQELLRPLWVLLFWIHQFFITIFFYMLSLCSLLLAFEFFFRRIDFFFEYEKNTTLSFERNRCIFCALYPVLYMYSHVTLLGVMAASPLLGFVRRAVWEQRGKVVGLIAYNCFLSYG